MRILARSLSAALRPEGFPAKQGVPSRQNENINKINGLQLFLML
jgi:hypothetical protein